MASRALAVAVTAAVLLVVVVAADVSMNRFIHLEAHVDGRWVKVASHPPDYLGRAVPGYVPFDLNASDSVQMRLRVVNGHPWAFAEQAEVSLAGRLVHSGTLSAGARSEGTMEFSVNGTQVLSPPFSDPGYRGPGEAGTALPWFDVHVGGDYFSGAIAFREVPRR